MSIIVKDLSKSYGTRCVFSDLSFEIGNGARCCIWGPNGSGKTTLIRLLSTLERPSAGQIDINGYDVRNNAQTIRQQIGLVSHQLMLYPDLTVLENLVFFGNLYGVRNPDAQARNLLRQLNLELRMHDSVKTLSRGMAQRVSLARALMNTPKILLLDEPFTGLDVASSQILKDILASLDSSCTIVMVTHDAQFRDSFATQIIDMTQVAEGC